MKSILILFLIMSQLTLYGQSGAVVHVGSSLAFSDNPTTNDSSESFKGWNLGLGARFGSGFWYLAPRLELHKMQLLSTPKFDPFDMDQKYTYVIKAPVHFAARLYKKSIFLLRASAGVNPNFIWSIQKNNFGLDHNTISDLHLGVGGNLGFDIGPLALDFMFEKGVTEYYKSTGYKMDYITLQAGIFF